MNDKDETRSGELAAAQTNEEPVEAAADAEPVLAPDVETVTAGETPLAGKVDDLEIPSILPIVPLKDTVIYPFVGAPLAVGQERTLKLMDDAVVGNRLVGFVASKDSSIDNPGPDEAYRVGVVGAIMRMMRLPNGTMQLAVQGLERIKIEEYTQTTPYLKARIHLAPDTVETGM
jgi:ATP-dependent Lon protease